MIFGFFFNYFLFWVCSIKFTIPNGLHFGEILIYIEMELSRFNGWNEIIKLADSSPTMEFNGNVSLFSQINQLKLNWKLNIQNW